ncbi:MAG: hypothetical protein J5942_05920 [Prevotella sp.]|nr:hypothetical protein [Prevotella sp.]MBP3745047.1 hypothetical protein [Prevotella sp.]
MDKYFICLANSYKHGGRCVAGIEVLWDGEKSKVVRGQSGAVKWIRPVSKETTTGEIPTHQASHINVLDVVRLEGVVPCPSYAQQENVFFQKMTSIGKHYAITSQLLQRFMDDSHRHVFYNYGKAVLPIDYRQGSHSILLIRVEHAEVYADEGYSGQVRYRISFIYHGHQYDFPITDPCYQAGLRLGQRAVGQKGTMFITCSLGLEYEGAHFKLAATVFETEPQPTATPKEAVPEGWFDEYERELVRLFNEKIAIEEQITELRMRLRERMERYGLEKVNSKQISVSYTSARTVMQFDSRSFRAENEELYSSYCRPKQREASIIVKRKLSTQITLSDHRYKGDNQKKIDSGD